MVRFSARAILGLGLLSAGSTFQAAVHGARPAPPATSTPSTDPTQVLELPGGFLVDDSAFVARGDQRRRQAMLERVRRCVTDHGLTNRYTVDVFQAKDNNGTFAAEKLKTIALPLKLLPDSAAALSALTPEDLDPASGIFSKKPFAYTAKQWTGEAAYFKFTADAPSMEASLAPLPSFMPHRMSRPDLDLRTVQRAVDWSGSLGTLVSAQYDGRQLQTFSRMDSTRGMLNASTCQLTPGIWSLSVGAEFSGPRIWGGIVYPLIDGNGLARAKDDPLAASRQGPYQNRVECTLTPMLGNTLLPWAAPTPWPVDAIKGDADARSSVDVLNAKRGKETICIPELALLDHGGWAVARKAPTWAPLQDDVRIDQSLDRIDSALVVVVHESISDAELARVLKALSAPPKEPAATAQPK